MSSATKHARAVLRPLAERGLLQRPLHLVFGPSALVDCLSPYCRDLQAELRTWANAHDTRPSQTDQNDQLYAIAEQFCKSEVALQSERTVQERLVGIGPNLIDTRRLDPKALDSRINAHALSPFDSVFILAKELNPGLDAESALALVELTSSSLKSIAISWPKGKESERFVESLRQNHAVPLHLLDTSRVRRHASLCRYLNNLGSPSPQPEKTLPAPPEKPKPKTKPMLSNSRIRIKA